MREFNALSGYPEPKEPRVVGPHIRTIHQRIVASYRGEEYYDGDRNFGYGGFKYDGRWAPIAKNMATEYGLTEDSAVLQIGCEKGFLLHDFKQLYPSMTLRGTDISDYVISNAMDDVKPFITNTPFTDLPFADGEFHFVIAIAVVYGLVLADAIQCLKEIQRVGRGKSFITLAAYETPEQKQLFEWWTLLAGCVLHKDEWREVMSHAGYTGDYKFTTAESLKLIADTDA